MSPTQRTGLIAFAAAGGLFLLAGLGVGALVLASGDKPLASKEGKDWIHKDLVGYLEGKGITLRHADSREDDPNGPAIDYWTPDGTHTIRVQRCVSPDKAKEMAGLSPAGQSFSWGRFRIVTGGGKFHDTLRQALAD